MMKKFKGRPHVPIWRWQQVMAKKRLAEIPEELYVPPGSPQEINSPVDVMSPGNAPSPEPEFDKPMKPGPSRSNGPSTSSLRPEKSAFDVATREHRTGLRHASQTSMAESIIVPAPIAREEMMDSMAEDQRSATGESDTSQRRRSRSPVTSHKKFFFEHIQVIETKLM